MKIDESKVILSQAQTKLCCLLSESVLEVPYNVSVKCSVKLHRQNQIT